jgi:hypothetical protein
MEWLKLAPSYKFYAVALIWFIKANFCDRQMLKLVLIQYKAWRPFKFEKKLSNTTFEPPKLSTDYILKRKVITLTFPEPAPGTPPRQGKGSLWRERKGWQHRWWMARRGFPMWLAGQTRGQNRESQEPVPGGPSPPPPPSGWVGKGAGWRKKKKERKND